MRSALIVLLSGLLIAQQTIAQQAADTGIEQNIALLRPKAHVELQLTDGTVERGTVVSRGENNFGFKPDNGGSVQTIAFTSLRSVSQIKSGHSKTKWIVIGVVAGAAVAVGVTALALKNHGPVLNPGPL